MYAWMPACSSSVTASCIPVCLISREMLRYRGPRVAGAKIRQQDPWSNSFTTTKCGAFDVLLSSDPFSSSTPVPYEQSPGLRRHWRPAYVVGTCMPVFLKPLLRLSLSPPLGTKALCRLIRLDVHSKGIRGESWGAGGVKARRVHIENTWSQTVQEKEEDFM